MLKTPLAALKSGTDIRGVAMAGASDNGTELVVNLSEAVVEQIAAAFALWLHQKTGKPAGQLTVAVGRDSRLSGEKLAGAVMQGLTTAGIRVLSIGLASTPAMFMTTVDLGCDAAIQITASHHPWYRNGLKFFLPSGGLEGEDITAILTLAQEGKRLTSDTAGQVEPVAYMDQYAARLRKMVLEGLGAKEGDTPLAGFHIVVDAGNGVGGFYAQQVLEPLGADISGSQFLEPDGRFPNHIPNPENPEAMASICQAVVEAGADLGVIFDTDVDRAGLVDAAGREINRNRLVALAAAVVLEDYPGGTIVTDSVTSDGLKVFIEQHLGGKHRRFKRGYKNVINEAIRLNQAGISSPLAIETSGHAALKENYFLDDGAYLVTRLIIKAAQLHRQGQTLDSLIANLEQPAEAVELRFTITAEDFTALGNRILADLEQYAHEQGWQVADDSAEGVRISFDNTQGDGFLLLRMSVHDPVMPLNIESRQTGGCRRIATALAAFMRQQTGVDITKLEQFIA